MSARRFAAAAFLTSGLALVASPAWAGDHQGDAPDRWVCHPVEGRGETGSGWSLIAPDKASSHIDEITGAGKHTRSDGRTDTYAVVAGGVQTCPGATTTTTATADPSTTTEATTSTTTTSTTTSQTSSATQSPSSSTSAEPETPPTTQPETPTVTPSKPAPGTTQPGPTQTSASRPKPHASTSTPDPAAAVPTLAFTGTDPRLPALGVVLIVAGGVLLRVRVIGAHR